MTTRLLIIGGGEHARVVLDAATSRPDRYEPIAIVAPDDCAVTLARFPITHLRRDDEALAFLAANPDVRAVLGVGAVGSSGRRGPIVAGYERANVRFCAVIHAKSVVSPAAEIADGVVVFAGAIVNPNAALGIHVVVGTAAVVEHDVVLERLSQVGPGAVLGGGAFVGAMATIGLGAMVRDHVRVGKNAVVGMGAVVVRDVPDGQTVVGNPAAARRK